jgi:hypothetical protein
MAHRWTGRGKVSSASSLAQRRQHRARGKGAGLTLAAAQCEGAEWRRRGGGRRWGREGFGERRGGPVTRGRGEGGGCGAALEQDEKRRGGVDFRRWRRQQHPFKGGGGVWL